MFSYLFLWTVSPQVWPKPEQMPQSIVAIRFGGFAQRKQRLDYCSRAALFRTDLATAQPSSAAIGLAVVSLCGSLGVEVLSHWRAGLRPDADAHAALVYMASFLQLQLVLALVVMAGFAVARCLAGMLSHRRRVVFDNIALLWHYTVAQGLFGLLLVHGFPRIA